ncbi:transforming acidic, partial [Lynx pardinus]
GSPQRLACAPLRRAVHEFRAAPFWEVRLRLVGRKLVFWDHRWTSVPLPLPPIVDVLPYTPGTRTQPGSDTKGEPGAEEHDALCIKRLQTGKIVDGFEGIVYGARKDAQRQKQPAKAEIQK